MVKDTLTQDGGIHMAGKILMAAGNAVSKVHPVIDVGKTYGEKVWEGFRVYEAQARKVVTPLVERILKVTREHADATTISVALALLSLGMCGLWFKLLWSTGI